MTTLTSNRFSGAQDIQSSCLRDTYFRYLVSVICRGSQLAAELLVIGVTWWYTYRSYRIRKGIEIGNTISSFLLYNGKCWVMDCRVSG